MDAPREPVIFFTPTSAIVGPNDPLRIPRARKKLIGEWNSLSRLGKKLPTFPKIRLSGTWPDLFCTTIIPSAAFKWNVPASG
jgi:hypothetical protein